MTKVKICGLSSPEAVAQAVKSGADYIGFVLAPSKRQVTLEQARELAQAIPAGVQKVGVFVSPSLAELEEAIASIPLDVVQVHGDFDDKLFEELRVPSIRALQVTSDATVLDSAADFLLFDAPVAGSGQTFDWNLLADKDIKKPYFIAGGLTADNVAEAQAIFQPYAVDVSSGVETDGVKDLNKIARFIESVKK
ncbi:phosphoribosylanthranilate isomerase [Streptococcus loxodontisalivarius]|uniref:N-(5'-phosphoribosyl)anthranilate isomerase n=1 Tax=Streptococcus loxodontisalivarius TaxID=1349415 RepID=A0ABS2PRD1_9STRE|nr:phosphoribosylanthranilate isomerase [Streptococcus loxodontisalivarius]MBM7642599.1 phosphoribosylanthranilate isomerase [Streptococcus loxodontisalivarius]